MASERTAPRRDGRTRAGRRSLGAGGVMIGLAALALVAVVSFFLLNANRNAPIRTNLVTSAASSMADSTAKAAKDVGNAGDALHPK